jgi:type II secretion system protein J
MKISLNRGCRRLPRRSQAKAEVREGLSDGDVLPVHGEPPFDCARMHWDDESVGTRSAAVCGVKGHQPQQPQTLRRAAAGLRHSRAPKAVHGEGDPFFLPAKSAFTLIEMILAIGVAAIVLVTISSVFFAAIRLRNSTQDYVDAAVPVDQTLAMIKRDLACVVTPTNGTTKILSGSFQVGDVTGNGGPVAIEMFTTTGELADSQPWGDIQRVTYELRDPTTRNAAGKDLFRSVTRDLLASTASRPEDQWMMGGVQSITFSCYDGTQWSPTWDTTGLTSANTNLPLAVRVDIQPVGNQLAPIEMVVPIDSLTRSNVVLNANTNGP